ncbi:MAG TPA: 4Fe-4S binding protein [Methanomassiliicoccales archaeon]|jgi:ferredoxin|nr:4Fe-4S binding protein [Euryarchaeota archaeon]HOE52574.1 4Fe-4S binding protein [Methanomassiliicoccales archaeon]HOO03482.1 4Fe-4S binding protein [Methanomassiliicoccales archaeon]HQM67118.1 4Fe-4S binding protein [Methanomassiliicoccales archaeon]HRR66627.1 4Fe-4S binding protein [Methanomassiliicoccales archaeon]
MAKRKFLLGFSPDLVNEAIVYRLVKDYDLKINILRAEVREQGGRLLMEVEGKAGNIKEAVRYLNEARVEVQELATYVEKNEERCTHCGMCLSICPVEALTVERPSWRVRYDAERCIACGMCIDACPPGAMKFRL